MRKHVHYFRAMTDLTKQGFIILLILFYCFIKDKCRQMESRNDSIKDYFDNTSNYGHFDHHHFLSMKYSDFFPAVLSPEFVFGPLLFILSMLPLGHTIRHHGLHFYC